MFRNSLKLLACQCISLRSRNVPFQSDDSPTSEMGISFAKLNSLFCDNQDQAYFLNSTATKSVTLVEFTKSNVNFLDSFVFRLNFLPIESDPKDSTLLNLLDRERQFNRPFFL